MYAHRLALAATMVLGSALAVSSQVAMVTIESSHSDSDVKNHTVHIPLSTVYADQDALTDVSYLYVTGAEGVPLESVTCTPFKFDNGTGIEGSSFSSSDPAQLGTTSTVRLGSIVCITNSLSQAPPPLAVSSSSSSAHHHSTSTKLAGSSSTTASHQTDAPSQTTAGAVKTASATPTPSHDGSKTNNGNRLLSSSEFFSGLALAGLGLAFAM